MHRTIAHWLVLAGYGLLIYVQSSLPSPDMGPELPGGDKLLHATAYAFMGVLACRAFATLRAMRSRWAVCLAGFLFTVLFGLSDEWHQSFIPARVADGWDLLADGLGAALGAVVYGRHRRDTAASGSVFPR